MKASGMDKLSSRVCKDAFMILGNQLTHLFNCSLSNAVFPDLWKVAKVIPLFKGGDREDVNNYRPVSLLPLPGKMLEKIAHKRITEFWEANKFLSKDQGGFRKGFSTVATIADLTDDLFSQVNMGNTTLANLFDLRKAEEDVNNYRPVSLLPLPGKMLEKIAHKRITEFWEANKFLSKDQGGFRKGFSTVATIADLTDDLFSQVNMGNTTLANLFDLRKAFDNVNIGILKKKLEKSGVRNLVLRWCTDYLTNRHQCTYVNGITSKLLPVTCGVPQGSVLGPLFFLVFVNDVQGALNECKAKLYADDTVLYQSGLNSEEAAAKLQESVDLFANWCITNSLTINIAKTKIMAFGSRQKVKRAKKVVVKLGGEELKQVPSYKYLGMILDSTLNYNLHVNQVIRTVIHKLILLSKMKKYLMDDVALSIYKSMLLPYFDYADVIFDKALNKDIDKLQKLQNKCLNIFMGRERRFNNDAIHKLANVPFLKDRREAHVLNFMYIRKKDVHLLNCREIRTRAHDAPLFNITIPRCEAFKRSVGYFGALSWNELTPKIRNTDTLLAFKQIQKLKMLSPLARFQVFE